MFAAQFIRVLIVLVILFLFDKCSGFPSIRQKQMGEICVGCGDTCDKCEYGIVKTIACGVLQCARGPDEMCGGPGQAYGICGEGMYCNCNRCMGCSQIKLKCAKIENPCLPYKSSGYHSRYVDTEDTLPPSKLNHRNY